MRSKGSKEFQRENFESFRQTNHTTPNIVTPNIVSEYSYSSIKPTELHTIAAQSSFRSLTRQHNTQSLAATKTVPSTRTTMLWSDGVGARRDGHSELASQNAKCESKVLPWTDPNFDLQYQVATEGTSTTCRTQYEPLDLRK